MTNHITAMKMALAKFEHLWEIGIDAVYKVKLLPEIQALRQAIEQAEKQEPRKEWVGLTTDEIFKEAWKGRNHSDFARGAEWAEAKLKEKNGG
jgi:hypothetical protein